MTHRPTVACNACGNYMATLVKFSLRGTRWNPREAAVNGDTLHSIRTKSTPCRERWRYLHIDGQAHDRVARPRRGTSTRSPRLRLLDHGRRVHRDCGGHGGLLLRRKTYLNLTFTTSAWLHDKHSNVRRSWSGSGESSMRASDVRSPHFGQGGR